MTKGVIDHNEGRHYIVTIDQMKINNKKSMSDAHNQNRVAKFRRKQQQQEPLIEYGMFQHVNECTKQ